MEHLNQYLKSHKANWLAAQIGVSNAYITKLRQGKTTPSLARAFQIERATEGKVPASGWVADAAGAEGKSQ